MAEGGFVHDHQAVAEVRQSENLLDEGLLAENGEGCRFFAGADEPGRDAELVVNGHGDAALARAVELGDDEAIQGGGFVKLLRLLHGVGSSGGIDHQQGEVRCGRVLLGEGAPDFP